jgi:hypothetical protein
MICHEIIFNKLIDKDVLSSELAKIFNIKTDNILITNETPTKSILVDVQVFCILHHLDGDFPQHLTIYIKNDSCKKISTQKLVISICKMNNLRALFSDESENPYTMNLSN